MPHLPDTHRPLRPNAERHIDPRLAQERAEREKRNRKDENRIRGRELQSIRARILKRDPLCIPCRASGRISASTQVDHVLALHMGGKETDANRQGICDDCHKDKTAREAAARAVSPHPDKATPSTEGAYVVV